jgi:hypothetical protein
LFVIGSLKGGRYCPSWGFSSGFVPAFRGHTFQRQSTARKAITDLVIDPIDLTGAVPPQAFGFITGYDTRIPIKPIRTCAEHFIPLALADFNRVDSTRSFCEFFLERSRLQYRRFLFHNYVQHQLAYGFVLIFMGQRDEGLKRIRRFCRDMDADFKNQILVECIRRTESGAAA